MFIKPVSDSDRTALWNLYQFIGAGTEEARIDGQEYLSKNSPLLTQGDFSKFASLLSKPITSVEYATASTQTQRFNDATDGLSDEFQKEVRKRFDAEIVAWQMTHNNEQPSLVEEQKILDEIVAPGSRKWYGGKGDPMAVVDRANLAKDFEKQLGREPTAGELDEMVFRGVKQSREKEAQEKAKRERVLADRRKDGSTRGDGTLKGLGFYGPIDLPNGSVATEFAMSVAEITDEQGNEIEFPTLVPTLTQAELALMVNDIIPNNKPIPDAIRRKAVMWAKKRIADGKSPFAYPDEEGGRQ